MRYQLSLYLIYSGFTETKAKIGLILVKNNFIQFFYISSRIYSYVHTFTKSVSFLKDTISSVNLPNRFVG